jgi:hypothetical protein
LHASIGTISGQISFEPSTTAKTQALYTNACDAKRNDDLLYIWLACGAGQQTKSHRSKLYQDVREQEMWDV